MTSANIRKCIVCQKDFKRQKRKKDAVRCCSRECGFQYLRTLRSGKKATPQPKADSSAECRHCKATFTTSHKGKAYCSLACVALSAKEKSAKNGASCVGCGAKRAKASAYCQACRVENSKRNSATEKATRKARTKKVITAPVSLLEVLTRYGWKCHICQGPIYLIPEGYGQQATLDHVVPLALGGWHDLTNLRPAHQSCNSAKGAKYIGQLMLTC